MYIYNIIYSMDFRVGPNPYPHGFFPGTLVAERKPTKGEKGFGFECNEPFAAGAKNLGDFYGL